MSLLLNPLLDALRAARNAASDVVQLDDEVSVDDEGEQWVFKFTPTDDTLGGGARVTIAKNDLRILNVVRSQ